MDNHTSNVDDIYLAALERESAQERSAYLEDACAGNPELRRRVERLLEAQANIGSFLEAPAPEICPTVNQPPLEGPGARIGPYKLVEQIGEGGMAVVYFASQREPLDREVALKIIKPGMDSREVVTRFEAERQALAMMDHPNIAKVFDAGVTDAGRPFFVMELIKRGKPITEYCDREQLTNRERLALFVGVCQGVQHAHQKGIIHRDLKPSNVLIKVYDVRPMPMVIDFGIAKAVGQQLTDKSLRTGLTQLVGTPLYMSPEQAGESGTDVDTRSDIYSLGVLLYELLTGYTPFEKDTLNTVGVDEMRRIIREVDPPHPSARVSTLQAADLSTIADHRHVDPRKLSRQLAGDLDWIVMKALEKDRTRRYETANAMATDVERYLHDEPVHAGPPSAWYRVRKLARRNRVTLVAGALVALSLIVGTAVSVWQAVRATLAEQRAMDEAAVATAVNAFLQKDLLGMAGSDDQLQAQIRPDPDVKLRTLLDRALTKVDERFSDQPRVRAEVQTTLADSLYGIGRVDDAVRLYEQVRQYREQTLGPEHLDTLSSMNTLAEAYDAAGQLDKGLPLAEKTLQLSKAKLGPEHLATLSSMNTLANAWMSNGQFKKAISLYQQTLELNGKILGPEHVDTLRTMNNLAGAYAKAGQADRALTLLEQTFKLSRKAFGPEDSGTLYSMNNLAAAYLDAGQLDKALPLLEQTLALSRTIQGPEHPVTLGITNNLAWAYRDAGQLDKALPLAEQTLELSRKILGPEHPHTLHSMNTLAAFYQEAGQLDKALPLAEQTLQLSKAKLGPEHPDTIASMKNLADRYAADRQLDKAISLFQQHLELARKVLGPEHPNTLGGTHSLAVAYRDDGQLDKALPLAEQTLELARKVLGPDHPNTLKSTSGLALAYLLAKWPDKALPLYEDFISRHRARSQPNAPQFAQLLESVSLELLTHTQFSVAERYLRECLAISDKAQPDAWSTFNRKTMLGGALTGQAKELQASDAAAATTKFAEAEPLLVQGYEGMQQREQQIPREEKIRLTEALQRLVELYTAYGKPEKAVKWQAALDATKAQAAERSN